MEKLWSEFRSFIINQPDWTLAALLNILRRWTYQNDLFADPEVVLPPPTSNKGFNRALYEREKSQQFVRASADWGGETRAERCEVLRALYAEVLAEEKPVMQALGMADVLREAGAWDVPPLESWASIEKLIAEEQERGDERMDE